MSDTPLPLPELSEPDVVRHFVNLSTRNFSVDTHFYPLGSCTMKYNPKRNERLASLPGMAGLHPYQPESTLQGMLALLHHRPAQSGRDRRAAGRFAATGRRGARRNDRHAGGRRLLPRPRPETDDRADSRRRPRHESRQRGDGRLQDRARSRAGRTDSSIIDDLASKLNDETAVFMITNPNTLGLFEPRIEQIAKMIHDAGGLVYLDGANMNAILGVTRPGDFGADMMHFNPHKTFSGPHGGGGPGAGPIAVAERLARFLPVPIVVKDGRGYHLDYNRPKSIGRVRSFFGSVGVLVRMYCYIRSHGPEGLRRIAEDAVLNANYLLSLVKDTLPVPHGDRCMHEFVASAETLKSRARHLDDGHRQAAARLRLSRPDGLFPADRPRGDDDRADRKREQSDAGRLCRRVEARSSPSRPRRCTTPRTARRSVAPTKSTAARKPVLRWKKG